MKKLAILGAGGHGNVVADIADALGDWSKTYFFDDEVKQKNIENGRTIVGSGKMLEECCTQYDGVFVAIGDNAVRMKWHSVLARKGAALVSLIHPSAVVSGYATIGAGTVVCPNVVINYEATIGAGCIVNTSAVVEHHCCLGDGVHVSPAVAMGGGVSIGQLSWVGIGAVVRHGITIGSSTMVGAGAVVVSDIPDNVTAVGNPAKQIR